MGKTTEDLIETEYDAGAEPVDMIAPVSSGMTSMGVQSSGVLAGSATDDVIGTSDYDSGFRDPELGHDAEHTTGTDGADEIVQTRSQIEETRAHMSETIDAIQYKLSPQHIAQQAKDTVRDATIGKAQDMVSNAGDTARGMGSGILETIKQNPIPAALAGLGIGWLVMSGRKSHSQSDYEQYRYRSYDYQGNYGYDRQYAGDTGYSSGGGMSSRVGAMAGQAQGAVGNMAGRAQDTAGQVAGTVQNTAGQVAGTVQDTASQVAGTVTGAAGQVAGTAQDLAAQAGQGISQLGTQAQYGAQRAQTGFQQMLNTNPMAVAAGAVALGLAVGLAIPETDKENELLGPARDQMMDQAQQQVSQVAQKAQTVAQEAVGAAKDAAQQAATDSSSSQS